MSPTQLIRPGVCYQLMVAVVALSAPGCGSVVDNSGRTSSATASSMTGGPGSASSATNSTTGSGGTNSGTSGTSGSSGAGGVDDCSAPTITVLAPKQEQITSIALDATNVYWGNQDFDGSRIRTMPKAGGLFTVLATTQYPPGNLAVDDTHVYWSEDHGAKSILYSVAKAGGPSAPQQLAVTTDSGCSGLSLDQDNVYWSGGGWIYSIPKSGKASLTELVQPDPADTGGRRAVIARNDRLYWLESQTRVVSMPKSGGVPTVLAAVPIDSARFSMDDDRIYVGGLGGASGSGQLLSVPTAGGPEAVLVADEEGLYQIAATSSCLYWTTAYLKENHLRAMPKSGGDPISIAPIDNQITAIAADASGVYWGERDNHRLMRATK